MARRDEFDVASVRAQFPALAQPQVFFDNAGGSQTLGTVISSLVSSSLSCIIPALTSPLSITNYLEATNVQLGASYRIGKQSTDLCQKGLEATAAFINADPDDVGMTKQLNLNQFFSY